MRDGRLTGWLDFLHDLLPPSHITLLGSGNGSGVWAQWLLQQHAPALLLEADPEPYRLLDQRLAQLTDSPHRAAHALIAPEAAPHTDTPFYATNLAAENGLLAPAQLAALWPNLHTVAEHRLVALTLHDALLQHGIPAENAPLWLFVDCLPAAPLLASAGDYLQQADVIVARVVLPHLLPHADHPPHIDGADADDLGPILPGMQQISLQATRHPAIAHTLYVRDYPAALRQHRQRALSAQTALQQQLDEVKQAAKHSRQELETLLTQQRQTSQTLQTRLHTEIRVKTKLQRRLERAFQARNRLETELVKKDQAVQALKTTLDAEAQARTEHQTALAQQQEATSALQTQLNEAAQTHTSLQHELKQAVQRQQELQASVMQQLHARQALQTALENETQAKTDLQHQLDAAAQTQHTLEASLGQQLGEIQALQEKLEAQTLFAADWWDKCEQIQQAIQNLENSLMKKVELEALFEKQAEALIDTRKNLVVNLKKEIANTAKQIEASISLQNYFTTDELPLINVESQAWPVSPDFAFYAVTLLVRNHYDLIIEFGSGISTSIIARTLAKMAVHHSTKNAANFVSFEHLEQYYQQTHEQLVQFGLRQIVQLHHAPFQDWQASDGRVQPYYTCQSELFELSKKYATNIRILVVVDGPPAATCKHARYPAGPLMLKYFPGAAIDLLLDDYKREDEKEVVTMWRKDISAADRPHCMTQLAFEKDACLLSIRTKSTQ